MNKLSGVLKGLKLNQMFVLRNGEIVKFVKMKNCYYGKNSQESKRLDEEEYKNAKTILDIGNFLTHHGTYRNYYCNGKCACTYLNYNPNYDIIKRFCLTSLELKIHKIMISTSIVEDVPTQDSLKAIRKTIKLFEKIQLKKELNNSIITMNKMI